MLLEHWIGLIGIVIPACAAVIGYWYKISQERKKSLRSLLFHALELRAEALHLYKDAEFAVYHTEIAFKDSFRKRGVNSLGSMPKPFQLQLKELIIDALNKDKEQIRKDLLTNFQLAIIEVAKTRPIVAHQYTIFIDYFKQVEAYIEYRDRTLESARKELSEKLQAKMLEISNQAMVTQFADSLNKFNQEIEYLAQKIGSKDYRNTKTLLAVVKNLDDLYDMESLKPSIEQVLDNLGT